MRIAGKKIEGPNIETVVIPRGDGEPIVLKAQAVLDYTEFERLCPLPKPPVLMRRGGKKEMDNKAPAYIAALSDHGERRIAWIILKSLQATPELEWETVKMDDPNTWTFYDDELTVAGFSRPEINRIINTCMAANCLDQNKLDKAREDFLAFQETQAEILSSQEEEQNSMPSGEPVNGGA